MAAAQLREFWDQLLTMKLSEEADQQLENQRVIERKLSSGLIDFVHNDTVLSVRRLLLADVKELYTGRDPRVSIPSENPLQNDFCPVMHPTKGGVRLSPNITYGCLVEDKLSIDAALWSCGECEQEIYCSTLDRVQHIVRCSQTKQEEEAKEREKFRKVEQQELNPLARLWICPVCEQSFMFTIGQIMRHKKSFSGVKAFKCFQNYLHKIVA